MSSYSRMPFWERSATGTLLRPHVPERGLPAGKKLAGSCWAPGIAQIGRAGGVQLATYNDIKARTQRVTGWGDGVPLHLAASMTAGLVSTTVTSPGVVRFPVPPSLVQSRSSTAISERTVRATWLTIRAECLETVLDAQRPYH